MSEREAEHLSGRNRRRELANRRINYTREDVDWASIITSGTPRPTNQESTSQRTQTGRTADQETERSPSPVPDAAALPPLDQDEIVQFYRASLQKSKRPLSRGAHDVLTLYEYSSDEEDGSSEHVTTVRFRESHTVVESTSSSALPLVSAVGRIATPWPRDDAESLSSRVTAAFASSPVATASNTTINLDRSVTSLADVPAASYIYDVTDDAPVRSSLRARFRRLLARVARPFRSCLGLAGRPIN